MNILYFGSKSSFDIVFCFSQFLMICFFSSIQSMDNAKRCPIFDTREEILQDLLDKKISAQAPIWHPVFNKQSYVARKESFGNVISANVSEIEFLNNHQIALTINENEHFMIDLRSNEQWKFSEPCMRLSCTLPMPDKTEKVLNWREDGCADIRIAPSSPYRRRTNQEFDYEISFLPLYYDENQPPLIWVKKNKYCVKDYREIKGERDSISEINIYESVYNSSLDPDGIISQCKEKFTTYYGLNQLYFQKRCEYPDCEKIQLYSLEKGFAVQAAEYIRRNYAQCSIIYLDKTGNIMEGIKNLLVHPCSMVLHPINRDIFAMMLPCGTIQYWNSKGILLATQILPMMDKNKFNKTFYSFGKYCSFSPDGIRLAAVLPGEIHIYRVPLRVQIKSEQLIYILFCLKNQNRFHQDVVRLLFNIFSSY